ncbi:MAG: tetratricopeptide repeat protein [Gemmataceae bacterium]|nr:tetratricopeptide repeat protein [Gemmataceae bacterium]
MATHRELFSEGKLKEAIAAATEAVKKAPGDRDARGWLADYLCFAGELERADKQLEAMAPTDPQSVVGFTQHRQLLRAETARQDFFNAGRAPDLLGPPSDRTKKLIEASILIREKKHQEAGKLIEEANATLPLLKGTIDGKPFAGIRDMDDLLAGVFEVLATNGKYFWVPMEDVERIEFKFTERSRSSRELLWRSAKITTKSGVETDVAMPALYAGSHQAEEGYATGRMTDFAPAEEGAAYRGLGQRLLAVGKDNEETPFLEIKEIVFTG